MSNEFSQTPHGVAGPGGIVGPTAEQQREDFEKNRAEFEAKVDTGAPRFIAQVLTNPGDTYPQTMSKPDAENIVVNDAEAEKKARANGYLTAYPGLIHPSSDPAEILAWLGDRAAEGKFFRFVVYDSFRDSHQGSRMDVMKFVRADFEAFLNEATAETAARRLHRQKMREDAMGVITKEDPIVVEENKLVIAAPPAEATAVPPIPPITT